MALLGVRLKALGYRAIHLPTFGYHLRPLDSHAAALGARLSAIAGQGAVEFDFVTFSFGGILLRAALGADTASFAVRRIVMLSPPNSGALLAAQVRALVPVHRLGWDPLLPLLPGGPTSYPIPACEIGILTGGTGESTGFNPRLPGDNDGKVRVDEARLPGSSAFKVIKQRHFQMPFAQAAYLETRNFLATGAFLQH